MTPATSLDPRQIGVWRARLLLWAAAALAALAVALAASTLPAVAGVTLWCAAAFALLAYGWSAPRGWHGAARYDLVDDELFWARGVLFRSLTVVPLGRVQHLDIDQGPIERRAGVARLVVHTAGTGSTEVTVPGLALAEAERLRDRIRAFVRADLA